MNGKQEKKRICTLYANEYHFELIALSYINGELKKKRDVVILTEKNIEETKNDIVEKMNFSREEEIEIKKIDCERNDREKFEKIKYNIENSVKTTIFVKGNENYIEKVHKQINWRNDYIKVVDSYDIEEIGVRTDSILKRYDTIINMLGEKDIKEA